MHKLCKKEQKMSFFCHFLEFAVSDRLGIAYSGSPKCLIFQVQSVNHVKSRKCGGISSQLTGLAGDRVRLENVKRSKKFNTPVVVRLVFLRSCVIT